MIRLLAAALALLLSGAGANAEPVSRERVAAALPELEKLAQAYVDEGEVPGLAIAVVHDDAVVYLKGFGVRSAGVPGAVDADTVFQLASMSKPISSTVVAALVGKGALAWDSRLADIYPAFRLHEAYPSAEVTVRDLFAHRSGLPGNAGNELEALGFERETILHRLRLVPPSSSFRAGYSYSNFGLTAGCVAAAAAAGHSWEEAAERELFKPLGMTSTSARNSDFVAHQNRAELHVRQDGRWTALVKRQPDAQAPAGGDSSTVRDLAQWMRLELGSGRFEGRQLIPAEALAQTHVPLMQRGKNPVSGDQSFYGLGWNVEFGSRGVSWGHAGAFSTGARTAVTLYPDSGFGIVVLANAFPSGVPEALSASFADLVFDGRVSRDWLAPWNAIFAGMFPGEAAAKAQYATPPATATPALALSAYAGSYANEYIGEARVVVENGALQLKLGPGGMTSFPLAHFDRDTFLYRSMPEAPDVQTPVRFEIGADGRALAVTIDDLDDLGLGRLPRTEAAR